MNRHEEHGRSDLGFEELRRAYHAKFGLWPPVIFMPENLAITLMKEAIAKDELLPPEVFPGSGCSCG
jgi:hypothetical protein